MIEDAAPAAVIWQEKEIGEALTNGAGDGRESRECRAPAQALPARKAHWIQHDDPDGYEAMVVAAER